MTKYKYILLFLLIFVGCVCVGLNLPADDAPNSELTQKALVYVIDIRTKIGGGVSTYVKKGIQKAEQANADAIVFDINTPGGKVSSTEEIIHSIQDTKTPTIAFVNRKAFSAGAMISAACDQIVMSSGAAIGASTPVDGQGNEAPEKTVSAMRTTIRSIAERQNRNPDIAEAMVDKKLFLVRLENGDIIKLRPIEYINEKDAGTPMEILSDTGELLTLSTVQALDYGFVNTQAEDLSELLTQYRIVEIEQDYSPNVVTALTQKDVLSQQEERGKKRVSPIRTLQDADVEKFEVTVADRTVFFLTSPYISALLLSLGGLGLLVEIRTPGFGIPGFLGLLFIGLFFGGHMLNQVSLWVVMLIFVLGLALIVVEVFVIPGFGIIGIIGLFLMLGSVFYTFFSGTGDVSTALFWLSISIILTSALAILATIFLPKSSPFQRFALSTVMSADQGYHSAGMDDFHSFIGKTGVALTPLRPAGTARIENRRLDVVTVGNFIDEKTPIKVLEVEGSKISVEALED